MMAPPLGASSWAQFVIAVFSGGTFVSLMSLALRWRGQSLNSEEQIRDHYAKEVARLTDKLESETREFRATIERMEKHWREMLANSERRHAECEKDRDGLRRRVSELEEEVRGLIRVIVQASIDKVIRLGDDVPVAIRDAANRAQQNLIGLKPPHGRHT